MERGERGKSQDCLKKSCSCTQVSASAPNLHSLPPSIHTTPRRRAAAPLDPYGEI